MGQQQPKRPRAWVYVVVGAVGFSFLTGFIFGVLHLPFDEKTVPVGALFGGGGAIGAS